MDLCCAYFRGKFYLRKQGSGNAALPVGNASAFAINHEITEVEQEDFTSLGGTACKISYINNATITMTLNCLKARNLALAFQGSGSYNNVPAGSVVDQEYTTLALDELIPLEFVPEKGTVVVTDDADPTPVTFVEGEDYLVSSAGIVLIEGGDIIVGTNLVINYDYGINTLIQALTEGQDIYELFFDGVNAGESGEQQVALRVFKVKFDPTATFNLLTTGEFASVELTGTILKDTTKVGTGVSKFYNVEFGLVS